MKTTIPDTMLADPAVQPASMKEPDKTEVTLEFADQADAQAFLDYFSLAQKYQITVGGIHAGLMCSALKHARLTCWRTP